ncbi:UvrD-helicase domain-containing protein [Methanosarcina sp. UBA5]|uniref:UvrD-helicase domain-containing protein n=1 Tax=Methanosarcina sp. UBA5 TaxID=1915593 RepID=UPI0025EAEBB5|nr:UvrD-helicase domain-containing protein [Methanosarcina sp. UBA5]
MAKCMKIWGGPGCGKTAYLMKIYGNLIQDEGYMPSDITVSTFRKTAANDLIQQASSLTKNPFTETRQHVGTLHSICNRLAGYPNLLGPKDIREFLEEYGYARYLPTYTKYRLGPDHLNAEETVYSGDPFDLYNWLRNTDTPVEKAFRYPGIGNILIPIRKIPKFVYDYEEFKEKKKKFDFSDQIQKVRNEKIELDTQILMIDEVQDLTRQQIEVVKMWEPNLDIMIIAGDPLQSIYGYLGGTPDFYRNWGAEEIILPKSYRLAKPTWKTACQILESEGMQPPGIESNGLGSPDTVNFCGYSEITPGLGGSELHLVRCNYQANAIAMDLAERGIVFGGLHGWTEQEINLFNTIFKFRKGDSMIGSELKTLVENYELKLFRYWGSKENLIEYFESSTCRFQLAVAKGYMTPTLCNILQSKNPTAKMRGCGKLKRVKIENALRVRKNVITLEEVKKIQILTIHGAKGLEADVVFLHAAITPRIRKSLLIPGEESAAEARVWYVGVTRARERLFVIKDKGQNYSLPRVVA